LTKSVATLIHAILSLRRNSAFRQLFGYHELSVSMSMSMPTGLSFSMPYEHPTPTKGVDHADEHSQSTPTPADLMTPPASTMAPVSAPTFVTTPTTSVVESPADSSGASSVKASENIEPNNSSIKQEGLGTPAIAGISVAVTAVALIALIAAKKMRKTSNSASQGSVSDSDMSSK
jgi:hypothetical protein